MVEQTYAPISQVDLDRLYHDNWAPSTWLDLEERTLELLEREQISEQQSRTMVYVLRTLAAQGEPLPNDGGELFLLMRPVLERLPGGYG